MAERKEELPEPIGCFRSAVIVEQFRLNLVEARKIAEQKADLAAMFSFNPDELLLFEFGLAKYLNMKKSECPTKFRKPKIFSHPVTYLITKAMNTMPEDYKTVNQIFDNEIAQLVKNEAISGHYTSRSILYAANFVSSFWLEQVKKRTDFTQTLREKQEFIQNKVLRRLD